MLRRRRRRADAAAVALAVTALLGCGEDGTGPSPGCTADVEITALNDPTPYFTWEPACGVAALFVEEVGGADMWYVTATSNAGIASGVRYGETPPGATEVTDAEPLEDGRTYFVYVARGSSSGFVLAGLRSFSP